MHEWAFANAALPSPVTILGLNLRPFSLGHELWLIREGSSLAFTSNQKPNAVDLPYAALVCSETFDELHGMNRDRFVALKLMLWRWRIARMQKRGMDLIQRMNRFLEYRNAGCAEFPGELPTNLSNARPLGAPYLLRLHNFVWLKLGKTESEAWDYPYGLAKMRYAEYLEGLGCWNIKGEYELEYDKARDEWERENPENTLTKVDDA